MYMQDSELTSSKKEKNSSTCVCNVNSTEHLRYEIIERKAICRLERMRRMITNVGRHGSPVFVLFLHIYSRSPGHWVDATRSGVFEDDILTFFLWFLSILVYTDHEVQSFVSCTLFSNGRINHVYNRDQQIVSKDSQNFSENTCVHYTSINHRLITFHFYWLTVRYITSFWRNMLYYRAYTCSSALNSAKVPEVDIYLIEGNF